MGIKNEASFSQELDVALDKNLSYIKDMIGQEVVNKARMIMNGSVNNKPASKERQDAIQYKVEGNKIIIYSEDPVIKFLEEGTKPHVIEPKDPRGVLAFQAQETVKGKKGKIYQFGDWVVAKKVNHPGTKGMAMISRAIFLTQKQIPNIVKSQSRQ